MKKLKYFTDKLQCRHRMFLVVWALGNCVNTAGSLAAGKVSGAEAGTQRERLFHTQFKEVKFLLSLYETAWAFLQKMRNRLLSQNKWQKTKLKNITVPYTFLKRNDSVNWQQLERLGSNNFLSNVHFWWILKKKLCKLMLVMEAWLVFKRATAWTSEVGNQCSEILGTWLFHVNNCRVWFCKP